MAAANADTPHSDDAVTSAVQLTDTSGEPFLATFRRSRDTGLWLSGHHRFHTLGSDEWNFVSKQCLAAAIV